MWLFWEIVAASERMLARTPLRSCLSLGEGPFDDHFRVGAAVEIA